MTSIEHTEKELLRLLDTPGPWSLLGIRNRALLSMLVTSGLTGADLWRMKCRDFDMKSGTIRIEREITLNDPDIPDRKAPHVINAPIPAECAQRLRKYVLEARPQLVGEYRHEMMFVSRNGLPLTGCRGGEIFKVLCRKAGIERARFRTVRRSWKKIMASKAAHLKGNTYFQETRMA